MIKKYPPTPKQQEIIQELMNSDEKGKCFFQIYCDEKQRSVAINAFSLLSYSKMTSVTSSLSQLQSNNTFTEQLSQKLAQCIEQCQRIQSSLWMINNQRNQRNCNSICLLMCLGIFISCVFSLWEMIFVTSSKDVVHGNDFQLIEGGNSTLIMTTEHSKTTSFIQFTQIILYIGLKLVSGFWAFFGLLLSLFCLCGCLLPYYKSIQKQYRQKELFRQRLMRNRQQSQQINLKKD